MDLEEVALLVLLEGCVGETCAAMEAEWAAEQCEDATLRELVSEIGADEKRHAELAWRFIRWATEQRPELGARLLALALDEAAAHRRDLVGVASKERAWVAAYGLVPSGQRRALRTAVLEDVVIPCLTALERRAAA